MNFDDESPKPFKREMVNPETWYAVNEDAEIKEITITEYNLYSIIIVDPADFRKYSRVVRRPILPEGIVCAKPTLGEAQALAYLQKKYIENK